MNLFKNMYQDLEAEKVLLARNPVSTFTASANAATEPTNVNFFD